MKNLIFTAGLPGSGKSFTISKTEFAGLPVVDCDSFKPLHPEYDPKNISLEVHDWSTVQARQQHLGLLSKGEDFIVDGTGTNVEKYLRWFQEAREIGYTITVIYVKVDTATSIKRNSLRERSVPVSLILDKASVITECMEVLGMAADKFITIENN